MRLVELGIEVLLGLDRRIQVELAQDPNAVELMEVIKLRARVMAFALCFVLSIGLI